MKIYAACLASYNNATLHGRWFDLDDYADEFDLEQAIEREVLMTSPFPNVTVTCPHCETERRGMGVAEGHSFTGFYECSHCDGYGNHTSAEEWAIHDYDGEGLSGFGEYPDLGELMEHKRLYEEHGDAWLAFKSCFGDSVTEDDFENAYRGQYESMADFAEEWMTECHGLKGDEPFFYWIDWERAARDLEVDFTFCDGYVFYSCW